MKPILEKMLKLAKSSPYGQYDKIYENKKHFYATDAKSMIRANKHKIIGECRGRLMGSEAENSKDFSIVFPKKFWYQFLEKRPKKLISLDSKEFIKIWNEKVEYIKSNYDLTTECAECAGTGTVTALYRSRDIDIECPKCDGMGQCTRSIELYTSDLIVNVGGVFIKAAYLLYFSELAEIYNPADSEILLHPRNDRVFIYNSYFEGVVMHNVVGNYSKPLSYDDNTLLIL